MFFDSVLLFSLAISSVISTALDFLFCDRSHLGDSGRNLQVRNRPGVTAEPSPMDAVARRIPGRSSSPVVGQEEEVGNGDGHLQPAPVGDVVGQQREEEEADAEEHLVDDSDRAPELHPHDLGD